MSGNARMREGFVEDAAPVHPQVAGAPGPDAPQMEKKPRATPAPIIEPSPAEQPPLAQEEWPIKVRLLYKAIRNNSGDKVNEVTMREPKAGDINRYGNPVRVNQEGDVVIDERKMTFMIAALTEILPPFIEEMDTRDWNSCAYRLRRFFLPDPAAW
jgi:hypothetical protein